MSILTLSKLNNLDNVEFVDTTIFNKNGNEHQCSHIQIDIPITINDIHDVNEKDIHELELIHIDNVVKMLNEEIETGTIYIYMLFNESYIKYNEYKKCVQYSTIHRYKTI